MEAEYSVQKAMGPEEQAVLAQIGALVQELSGGAGAAPAAEPDGDEGMSAPGVSKASEQGTTPAEPQSAMQPGAAPKQQGMAPWKEGDEVEKAMKVIAKALMSSDTEGPDANATGDERLEDAPKPDEENINEVAKKLRAAVFGKKTVAKSMSAAPSVDLSPIMTVLKSLDARISQQGQVIGEILGGLGVEAPAPVAPSSVAKSMGAPLTMADIENVVTAVAKGMGAQSTVGRNDGIPVAKGFERDPFGAEMFGDQA